MIPPRQTTARKTHALCVSPRHVCISVSVSDCITALLGPDMPGSVESRLDEAGAKKCSDTAAGKCLQSWGWECLLFAHVRCTWCPTTRRTCLWGRWTRKINLLVLKPTGGIPDLGEVSHFWSLDCCTPTTGNFRTGQPFSGLCLEWRDMGEKMRHLKAFPF